MTSLVQQIVGFDAREMWQDFHSTWSFDRKESMLIRQDIMKPLSTNQHVWHDVFGMLEEPDNGVLKLYQDSRLQEPEWKGTLNLWKNLQVLQDHLNAGWGNNWEHCCLIAITILPQTFNAEEQAYWAMQLTPTVPATLDANWQFLGFDVSDGYLLSGLMDCGHPASDAMFIPYLNAHHLLTDLDEALKFKALMNAGNKAHAPFFVYGLYSIQEAMAGKNLDRQKFLQIV